MYYVYEEGVDGCRIGKTFLYFNLIERGVMNMSEDVIHGSPFMAAHHAAAMIPADFRGL